MGAVCAVVLGGLVAVTGAASEDVDQVASGAAPEGGQPGIVEDYEYPGADQILEERGITLKRGDGRILLVECDDSNELMEVWSRSKGRFCFSIAPQGGYLALEVPEVYGAKGDDHSIEVTVTNRDRIETYDVSRNGWTPIGEGDDPDNGPATLLEIRADA
ncbi:hypothetical protein [Amycolatopsis aidingensis]|uniref:hypothetical protein n=1 Tax=Amycolatopsis aidingensis TaxID=2842453 RepID=UPI001C0DC1E5|nr:hypothetical protein [Amycolatopsis aidingensis]